MDPTNTPGIAPSPIITQDQIKPGTIKPRHLAATPTVALGDLFYSNGTDFVKLAPGSAGQVLTLTNGMPAWVTPTTTTRLQSKTGTFTRDLTLASGSQVITGVGFVPTSIIFHANADNVCISNGGTDSTLAGQAVFSAQSASYVQSGVTPHAGLLVTSSGSFQFWDITSYDSDGFTLAWSKVSTPVGNGLITFIAYR